MKKFLITGALVIAACGASWLWTAQTVESSTTQGVDTFISREDRILDIITDQAEMIVTGKCTGLRSEWVQNGRVLVTLASIEVSDTLKGGAVETLTVALPGGIDANRSVPVAMTYPDAARVNQDEQVVLFLNSDDLAPGAYAVTGSQQGKFSIVEGEDGERLVSRDNIRGKAKAGPGVVRGNRSFVPEETFKGKIREFLN